MANIKNAVKLGVFTLAIMNVTAVVSPAWTTSRGRIWNEFGLLLSFCSYCLSNPYIARCSRVGGDVSG